LTSNYDDYDELEFELTARCKKRVTARTTWRGQNLAGRPITPRFDEQWGDDECDDFDAKDAYDYMEFDDYFDDSPNR